MIASLAVALIGALVLAAGVSLEREPPRRIGGNVPINAGAVDLRDISAHNSPSLVRNPANPANLAVVNRIDSPLFSCALHVSHDAGATWQRREVPFPPGEELPARCFAPDAAFGADGTLYVSFVTLKGIGNAPNAVWLVRSADEGQTLSAPLPFGGPMAFQVRLSADPAKSGRLYLSWLQAEDTSTLGFPATGYPILVSRSDDGGDTWSSPVRASSASRQRVLAPSTAVGPDGVVNVVYLDLGDDAFDYHAAHGGRGGDPYEGTWALVLARSSDRGATWSESVVEPRLVPAERIIPLFPPSPSLAVDPDGRVYVAFTDARHGDPDAMVWASGDAGRSFDRQRVNDTPERDGTAQYLPKVAVAADGRVDVVYYDRRADRKNTANHVSLQSSFNNGKTFGDRVRLSERSFDSRVGFGSERGLPDLGSRLGLVSTPARALAVWTDTRAGTPASGKQDLARAVVAFSAAPALRTPLMAAGAGVAAVGTVGFAWSALRARRRPGAGSPDDQASPP